MPSHGKEIWRRWERAKMDNWQSHWQEVALLEHPLESWINTDKSEGEQLHNQVFNNIGEEALGVFVDGFVGSTMPKTEQWAEFDPISFKDEDGRETQPSDRSRKAWQKASDRFIKHLADTNFYEAMNECIKDAGAFGNGCPGVFEGEEDRLVFLTVAPAQFDYDESGEGTPSRIRRIFKFTAHQIRETFEDKAEKGCGKLVGGLPKKVLEALEDKPGSNAGEKFRIIEEISRNPEAKPVPPSGIQPWSERAYISRYAIEKEDDHFFEEGYYEKPWTPFRLEKSSQERLGRGLGMKALPTLRKIQKMEKEYLRALEKANDPGWLVHADSDFKEDGRAGGLNFWDGDASMKPELNQISFGFVKLEERIEKEENKVRSMHFNDLFKLFLRDDIATKELKAAQVDAMMEEKLPLLVGIANRFLNECLKPLLRRAFMILLRSGAFDDLRDDLGSVNLFRISFRSRIAMAVKTLETRGILQVFNATALAAQFDPQAVFKIDIAGMLGRLAENSTAPSEFVRTEDEYRNEVEAFNKRQALMQAGQFMKDMGAGAKGFQGAAK